MKYKLKINLEFYVEAENVEGAKDQLADMFAYNNETVDTVFWEGIEVEKLGE